MPDFCTCGAQLPPDARFCHKCGKPQYDYPGIVEEPEPEAPPPLPAKAPLLVIPEIGFHNRLAVRIGFIAALAAVFVNLAPLPLPLVRSVIAFLAAGFLAVFLYSRRTGQIAQHPGRSAHRVDHWHLLLCHVHCGFYGGYGRRLHRRRVGEVH